MEIFYGIKKIKIVLSLLRPHQWIKNLFVFLPLFFHGALTEVDLLLNAFIAFISFCFASSGVYCLNDICDRESDRLHPQKRMRPIASGEISLFVAHTVMFLLFVASLAIPFGLHGEGKLMLLKIIILYIIINIGYCLGLKRIALLDVFIISLGFVLRVFGGGVVTCIELSIWIIPMTFLLALFLALAKRRDDVLLLKGKGVKVRENVTKYNLEFLNQCLAIVASITLVSYIMYSISPEIMEQFHSRYVYTTTIFVLLGILRYLQIALVEKKSGSPTKILLKDTYVQFCILGWILTFVVIIYIV